jgi:hypothetical protein
MRWRYQLRRNNKALDVLAAARKREPYDRDLLGPRISPPRPAPRAALGTKEPGSRLENAHAARMASQIEHSAC